MAWGSAGAEYTYGVQPVSFWVEEDDSAMAGQAVRGARYRGQTGSAAVSMLDDADRVMRDRLVKGCGDAPTDSLLAAFIDQTEGMSGERQLIEDLQQLLAEQITAAAEGRFASPILPEDYVQQALRRHQAQLHRVPWLTDRLQQYLEPAGKRVARYIRDRQAGVLVQWEDSAGGEGHGTDVGQRATALLGRLYERALSRAEAAADDLELAEQRRVAEPRLPTSLRPPAGALQQAENEVLRAAAAVDAAQARAGAATPAAAQAGLATPDTQGSSLPSFRPPARRRSEGEIQPAGREEGGSGILGGEEGESELQGSGVGLSAGGAVPLLSPVAPPPPMGWVPDGPPARVDLAAQLQFKQQQYERLQAAGQDWEVYDRQMQLWQTAEQRYSQAAQQEADAAKALADLLQQQRGATPGAGSGTGGRLGLVEGFMNPLLGRIITPSLAVYYTVRATLEAVYQLAGELDEASYLKLTIAPGTSLRSWGGTIRVLAKCHPRLTPEQHRSIYLRGVTDRKLRESLDTVRRLDTRREMSLDDLITTTEELADKEVAILREQLSDRVYGGGGVGSGNAG